MIKEKFLKVVTASVCIATLILPHTSVVLAAALTNEKGSSVNKVKLISSEYHEGGPESSESLSDEGIDKYDRQQYKYTFGGATDILKVLREDDKNEAGSFLYSDAFYCLDGNNSFPSIDGSIEYNRVIEDFFAENPSTLGLSGANYNSLCWLLNNMYLRKQMTAEQRAAQKDAIIESAFADLLSATYEDRTTVDDIKAVVTDDDIEVVQQWAIWYFTNYGEKTIQNVPFTNDSKTLPTIDLTNITGKKDSMDNVRRDWLNTLYQYFVNKALENKSTELTTSTSHPSIKGTNATIAEDGDNYKVGPFTVTVPTGCSDEYQVKVTNGTSEITNYTVNGTTDKSIPANSEFYIYLPKSADVKTVKLTLSYYATKASVWTTDRTDYQPLVLLTREGTDTSVEATLEIKPDLALRKYIVKVNDTEITNRTPNVDISKLQNGTSTTAEYKHRKDAVEVKVGDTVTYRIAVYNEGNVVAQPTEIVDYLPTGLEFVTDNETNKKNGWELSEDGTFATVAINWPAEMSAGIPAFADELKGVSVDIVCKVTDKATAGSVLTNIAEIKSDNIEDRDSTTDSLKDRISSIDKATYTGKDNKADLTDSNYYYKGQEDDDDFEKVVVAGKPFDLSLQKFITKVNGKELSESREPVVDTTPLKNGKTTADYKQVKTPVLVQAGDIVTYKIRVYNEGEVDGYAEKIADYLPDGLGYLVNYNSNIDNYWAINKGTAAELNTIKLSEIANGNKNLKVDDFTGVTDLNNVEVVVGSMWESDTHREKDACMSLTTTALSSSKSDNLIKAFDGSDKLSYKDVEVTCIVLGTSSALRNVAEVANHKTVDGLEYVEFPDRDSTPDNNMPWWGNEDEDDCDYEILTMKKFDLALQKFISGLNDKEITDRAPKISYTDGKIKYEHPQTALEVNNGDNVTYTIRVYNEGEIDGYAAEIGDDIPSGLVFDSSNETNKKYGWKMYDSNGNETTDSSKATEIRTDYLSKEKSEARKESALLKAFDAASGNLFYMDVKAVFKVAAKSSNDTITNTAEITKDTDEDGNEIEDIDSTPNNKKDGEDDIDKERVHVGYFDLALQKDLVKAVVTEGDSTKEIPAANGQLLKVEINRKKINSTIVKFVYDITIKNEGTIAGYAKEIKDYIPEGLQFVEADNQNWKASSDNVITTEALADKLLQPGETATVQVVLRWVNNENNMGMKTNVAEISKDYNDANDVDDIDSTPDNKKDGEDDIDDAPVILSISTGRAPMYIILTTGVLTIISTGVVMIKKYVL